MASGKASVVRSLVVSWEAERRNPESRAAAKRPRPRRGPPTSHLSRRATDYPGPTPEIVPSPFATWPSMAARDGAPVSPNVDRGEEEQPDDVDEVPVPGRKLEAEVLLRRKVAEIGAEQ